MIPALQKEERREEERAGEESAVQSEECTARAPQSIK